MAQPYPIILSVSTAHISPKFSGVAKARRDPKITITVTAQVCCHCQCLILEPKYVNPIAPAVIATPCGKERYAAFCHGWPRCV